MPTTQNPDRRTRVSSYQARIERSLTDIFFEVPAEDRRQASQEWKLVGVSHIMGYAVCELCGHNPIRRLFFIQSETTGETKMVGSECARNYASVDLVDAYLRRLTREQGRRRALQQREERREAQRAAMQARIEARQAAEAQVNQRAEVRDSIFASAQPAEPVSPMVRNAAGTVIEPVPGDVVAFLSDSANLNNDFLRSVSEFLTNRRYLTERQVQAVRRNLNRPAPGAAPVNQDNEPAEPGDCPEIFNGTYTIDDGREHLTYKIHTVRNGPLAGKRIIKRLMGHGGYEGFAFLTRSGGVKVWRRFANDENTNAVYILWAKQLVAQLRANVGYADSLVVNGFTISVSRLCRICNRQLTTPTSVERGIGPECEARQDGENRTTAAAPRRTLTVDLDLGRARPVHTPGAEVPIPEPDQPAEERCWHWNRQGSQQCLLTRRHTGRHSYVQRAARRATVVSSTGRRLALSEVGTGEIQ